MIWDENTLLMVDRHLIAAESNSSLVREEAYKYADNPLVRIDDPTLTVDGRADGLQLEMVVREGGRYRMWYRALGVREALAGSRAIEGQPPGTTKTEAWGKSSYVAYAESDDGIEFHPVPLNQAAADEAPGNNLIEFPSGGDTPTRQCGLFHDPLDREFPYKCLYYRPGKGKDFDPGALARFPHLAKRDWWFVWGIGRSRDGLSWEPPRHRHNLVNVNPEHAHLHRALDGGLVLADQMMSPVADWGYRNVKGWVTYDEETAHRLPDYVFKVPEHMVRAFGEFVGPNWDRVPWIQPHVGLRCARKGPTIVALNGYIYGAAGRAGAETFAQTADIGLCVSPTGYRFEEVWPFRPFIPRGPRGTWDFGMTRQSAIVDHDDETRFYYVGNAVGNFSGSYQSGMAYIPRDRYGFRCISGYRNTEKVPKKATLTLTPLLWPKDSRLAVNCEQVTGSRTIRLQLKDEAGQVIPGYAFDDCRPVTANGLRVPLRWTDDKAGTELADRTIQIEAELFSPDCGIVHSDSPRLYAIYLK